MIALPVVVNVEPFHIKLLEPAKVPALLKIIFVFEPLIAGVGPVAP
jgi:hypothetical protein